MYNDYTLLFEVYVMNARYTSATGIAGLATLSLLFLMQALIAMQPGAASQPRPRASLDSVRVKQPEELRTDELPRPDASLKEAAPAPPRPALDNSDRLPIHAVTPLPPAPDASKAVTALRMTDGPLVAIVRVQPVYPAVAEARGLEGWVLVQFDVLADGHVANAFVVESSNRQFEKAALGAAYRFRFKPRVVDAVPVATTGIQNLFRFEIPDS
jgi:protein TonB